MKKRFIMPDDYSNNGLFEVMRFGTDVITTNIMTPEQNAEYKARFIAEYPAKKAEIDGLISSIKQEVLKCNPVDLLTFSSKQFLLSILGKSSEIQMSEESNNISRMTEYIQSVLVSCKNMYVAGDEDPTPVFKEISAEIAELYSKIQQFNLYLAYKFQASHMEYDKDVIDFIVQSQMLYLVRGQRYQVHQGEYFERLLREHNDIFVELYSITADEISLGIQKLEHSLSQGIIDSINELDDLMQKWLENGGDDTIKAQGGELIKKIVGAGLNDVIAVTGWSENFVKDLAYGLGEDDSFFKHPEFAGWPIIDLPVQKKPFIKIEGRYYCFDYYTFTDYFYRAVQKAVTCQKPQYTWADFQKIASEKMAADVLASILPGCTIYSDNYYPCNGSLKNLAENDLLVLYNDVLLIVEVKAGSFVYTAPMTDVKSHIKSLRTLIEKADHQCKRTYDYLKSKEYPIIYTAEKKQKAVINMRLIRDIYMLSITVDNINSFACRAEKLSFLKLECNAISIAIDDLMVYRDYFESPLYFLHFLKQRRLATNLKNLMPFDELDHLGMYIKHNCYSMYFKSDERLLRTLYGYREELDNYFCSLYHSKANVVKPKQILPKMYIRIMDFLLSSDIANKVEISNYLLDFSSESREQFSRWIENELQKQKQTRGFSPFSTSGKAESLHYTCIVCSPYSINLSEEQMREYVLSILAWNDESERVLLKLSFDTADNICDIRFLKHSPTDIRDGELDILKERGRERAERLLNKYRNTVSKKIGRNDPCPCGSGEKYKNCCGRT